jgi:hypothetical protein
MDCLLDFDKLLTEMSEPPSSLNNFTNTGSAQCSPRSALTYEASSVRITGETKHAYCVFACRIPFVDGRILFANTSGGERARKLLSIVIRLFTYMGSFWMRLRLVRMPLRDMPYGARCHLFNRVLIFVGLRKQ